ncbi:MAG: MBL fold metallo-hydrolase [Acaryochloridaceae cyanobacterium SU_2_1]|nr:MBL fold metallo-hydrolase [Acaryochloridaceae cyanobacterium SU_2_1]
MARIEQRRSQNSPGNFYVDDSCIDCDTCRWMVPTVFHRAGEQSAVHHQPTRESERFQALQALLACPTASIGSLDKPQDIRQVQQSFPTPITANIYHCGYHSAKSFGAASYFIRRPEGNILIDSPRFTPPLVKQLEALGGIHYLYLTHRDDVADHAQFQAHFGCRRILHQADINRDTQGIELPLQGTEPYSLAEDLLIIPVPGHSPGHTVLVYDHQYLFTGDHLAWSAKTNSLTAFRRYCHSWPDQIQSMRQLLQYDFTWILPGHGRRYHADSAILRHELQACIAAMEAVA